MNEEEVVESDIGSRPPKCELRCNSCGHCEAVQVPITTPITKGHIIKRRQHSHSAAATYSSSIAYARGDGTSNYKPMSWKCKCGDIIFNP